jgi:hypothetical protein
VSHQSRLEYLRRIYDRYAQASRGSKGRILDEFCKVTRYHRKYALRLLNGRLPRARRRRRQRRLTYPRELDRALEMIWKAAGYPWSVRLKALLPLWLPCARREMALGRTLERHLLAISARQMDRRLRAAKSRVKKRLYGRTKPGVLLKHHIPVKTDSWAVTVPGFAEIDLVAHSGNSADGEFVHSLNLTDIHTTWGESFAVLGKGQTGIRQALETLRSALPFALRGIDSDNGSEFINYQLYEYCREHGIQFTRGRPYKKDDNAHIEQKNWTQVRKLLGYVRYDSPRARDAINTLYRHDLRLLQNLFLPSVKLLRKERVGSRLRRRYDQPQTPLDRVLACKEIDPERVARLKMLRDRLNPFELSQRVDQALTRIYTLANHRPPVPSIPKKHGPGIQIRPHFSGLYRDRVRVTS